MSALPHPAWCEQDRCTANPEAVVGGEPMTNWGQHKSAWINLPNRGMFGSLLVLGEAKASLSQSAAPWPTETMVCLAYTSAKSDMILPLSTAQALLSALSDLVGLAHRCDAEAQS